MHPKLEEKLNLFVLSQLWSYGAEYGTGEIIKKCSIDESFMEELFKTEYIMKKYSIGCWDWGTQKILVPLYNWEKDEPTNEFLIILAQEKI